MNDVIVPEEKWEILKEAEHKIAVYEELFRDGLVSEQERYEYVISVWTKATEDITKILVAKQDPTNSISIMVRKAVWRSSAERWVSCTRLSETVKSPSALCHRG